MFAPLKVCHLKDFVSEKCKPTGRWEKKVKLSSEARGPQQPAQVPLQGRTLQNTQLSKPLLRLAFLLHLDGTDAEGFWIKADHKIYPNKCLCQLKHWTSRTKLQRRDERKLGFHLASTRRGAYMHLLQVPSLGPHRWQWKGFWKDTAQKNGEPGRGDSNNQIFWSWWLKVKVLPMKEPRKAESKQQ